MEENKTLTSECFERNKFLDLKNYLQNCNLSEFSNAIENNLGIITNIEQVLGENEDKEECNDYDLKSHYLITKSEQNFRKHALNSVTATPSYNSLFFLSTTNNLQKRKKKIKKAISTTQKRKINRLRTNVYKSKINNQKSKTEEENSDLRKKNIQAKLEIQKAENFCPKIFEKDMKVVYLYCFHKHISDNLSFKWLYMIIPIENDGKSLAGIPQFSDYNKYYRVKYIENIITKKKLKYIIEKRDKDMVDSRLLKISFNILDFESWVERSSKFIIKVLFESFENYFESINKLLVKLRSNFFVPSNIYLGTSLYNGSFQGKHYLKQQSKKTKNWINEKAFISEFFEIDPFTNGTNLNYMEMNHKMKEMLNSNIFLGEEFRSNGFSKFDALKLNDIYSYFIQRFNQHKFKWNVEGIDVPDCVFDDCINFYDTQEKIISKTIVLYEKRYIEDQKFYIKIYYVCIDANIK